MSVSPREAVGARLISCSLIGAYVPRIGRTGMTGPFSTEAKEAITALRAWTVLAEQADFLLTVNDLASIVAPIAVHAHAHLEHAEGAAAHYLEQRITFMQDEGDGAERAGAEIVLAHLEDPEPDTARVEALTADVDRAELLIELGAMGAQLLGHATHFDLAKMQQIVNALAAPAAPVDPGMN